VSQKMSFGETSKIYSDCISISYHCIIKNYGMIRSWKIAWASLLHFEGLSRPCPPHQDLVPPIKACPPSTQNFPAGHWSRLASLAFLNISPLFWPLSTDRLYCIHTKYNNKPYTYLLYRHGILYDSSASVN
jgi:hypothetical protein